VISRIYQKTSDHLSVWHMLPCPFADPQSRKPFLMDLLDFFLQFVIPQDLTWPDQVACPFTFSPPGVVSFPVLIVFSCSLGFRLFCGSLIFSKSLYSFRLMPFRLCSQTPWFLWMQLRPEFPHHESPANLSRGSSPAPCFGAGIFLPTRLSSFLIFRLCFPDIHELSSC